MSVKSIEQQSNNKRREMETEAGKKEWSFVLPLKGMIQHFMPNIVIHCLLIVENPDLMLSKTNATVLYLISVTS